MLLNLLKKLFKKEEVQESSTSLDIENLKPILLGVSSHIESGFGNEEVERLYKFATEMKHDEEKDFDFPIIYDGKRTILKVGLFMDDIDSPDISFYSPPALASKIDEQFDKILS